MPRFIGSCGYSTDNSIFNSTDWDYSSSDESDQLRPRVGVAYNSPASPDPELVEHLMDVDRSGPPPLIPADSQPSTAPVRSSTPIIPTSPLSQHPSDPRMCLPDNDDWGTSRINRPTPFNRPPPMPRRQPIRRHPTTPNPPVPRRVEPLLDNVASFYIADQLRYLNRLFTTRRQYDNEISSTLNQLIVHLDGVNRTHEQAQGYSSQPLDLRTSDFTSNNRPIRPTGRRNRRRNNRRGPRINIL